MEGVNEAVTGSWSFEACLEYKRRGTGRLAFVRGVTGHTVGDKLIRDENGRENKKGKEKKREEWQGESAGNDTQLVLSDGVP